MKDGKQEEARFRGRRLDDDGKTIWGRWWRRRAASLPQGWGARRPRTQRGGLGGRSAVGAQGTRGSALGGRRSYLPTKFSSTELLPALWPPTTAICGKSRSAFWPMAEKASCSRLTSGMRSSMPRLPMVAAGPEGCDPPAAPAPAPGSRSAAAALRPDCVRRGSPRPSGPGAERLSQSTPEGARGPAGLRPCAGAARGALGIVVFSFCAFLGVFTSVWGVCGGLGRRG